MTLDCIIPDGPTAFAAVEAPDGFDGWVESVLSTFTFDLNVLALDLGITYEANSRTGYHPSSRQVWLEPRLMDTRYGGRVVPHEYGHAVEILLLTVEDRAELMDAWQVPGTRTLTTWRNALEPHDKRPREAFASYFGRIVSPDHAFPWSVNDYYHEGGMAAAETVIRRAEDRARVQQQETTGFADVAGHPHRDAIERLAALGIVTGHPDGRFGPQEPVTRAQVAVMLARLLDHLEGP